MVTLSARESLKLLWVVDADDVDEMPWTPVPRSPGVHEKVLWHFANYVEALIKLEPGAVIDGAPHLAASHHIWVVSGSASIAGRLLSAGSYVHVPPGVSHPIVAVGPEGATLLQMHRPHPSRESARLVEETGGDPWPAAGI